MYREGGEAMKSEIERMREFEWPLDVSAKMLSEHLEGKTVGDIGAGPNPNLGKLVESRGGKYVALDMNFAMAKMQKESAPERNAVNADITHLPFQDGQFDILHTRFVMMNLPASQRADAIRELARCGKENVVLDYDWTKFQSESPQVQAFIVSARKLGELAGSDLDFGWKSKQFIEATLARSEGITEERFNQGPIKDYKTIAGLAKSMQGLAKNLQNMETQSAAREGRAVNQELIETLNGLIAATAESESQFAETAALEDQSGVIPFTSPDIVAVTF